MRRLPEVLAERRPGGDAWDVELDLRVPADLEYFTGHFPGAPVLPGVVQIDWCVQLARDRLALPGAFRGLEQVKFLAPIGPDARITLRLALRGERLRFGYLSKKDKHSLGMIVFGA